MTNDYPDFTATIRHMLGGNAAPLNQPSLWNTPVFTLKHIAWLCVAFLILHAVLTWYTSIT